MKKILFLAVIAISSFSYAQKEIKLDVADALVIKTLELSYEHYIGEQSSVGLSALFSFEEKTADFRYNEYQMFTPYFRHYFTTEKTWNLFGELFLGINSGYKEIEVDGGPNSYKNYSDGAFGIAVGSKYISESGLTVDIHGGVGRNLFGSDSPLLVPRIGLNVGWRF